MSLPQVCTHSSGQSKKKQQMMMQSAMACHSWTGIVASVHSAFTACLTSWIGTGLTRSGGGSSFVRAWKRLESILHHLPWASKHRSGVPMSASISPTVHKKSTTCLAWRGFLRGASSPNCSCMANTWRKGSLSSTGDRSGGKPRVLQNVTHWHQ